MEEHHPAGLVVSGLELDGCTWKTHTGPSAQYHHSNIFPLCPSAAAHQQFLSQKQPSATHCQTSALLPWPDQ